MFENAPTPPPPARPLLRESQLRDSFVLTAKALAAIRHHKITEKIHWKKVGREIHYTENGAKALAAILTPAPAPDAPDAPEALQLPEPEPGEDLTITRCNFANIRIVQAEKENGELFRVRIRPCPNYRKGMVLKGCQQVNDGDFYEYRGRAPRNPGRW